MAVQGASLNTDADGKRTSAVWSDDGAGTSRWLLWSRNAILERVVKAISSAYAATAYGMTVVAVRRDTAAASSDVTGDYEPLQTDALGRLRTTTPVVRAGGTGIAASSGNVAASAAVATLPAGGAAVTTYITGFEVTAGGATAAANVTVAITGTTNTLSFTFTAPAGATLAAAPLIVAFPEPIPASAANTAIVVTVPSLGAGNTHATVTAHGFTR